MIGNRSELVFPKDTEFQDAFDPVKNECVQYLGEKQTVTRVFN